MATRRHLARSRDPPPRRAENPPFKVETAPWKNIPTKFLWSCPIISPSERAWQEGGAYRHREGAFAPFTAVTYPPFWCLLKVWGHCSLTWVTLKRRVVSTRMSIGGFGLKREREGRKRLGLPPDLCCLLNTLFLFLSFRILNRVTRFFISLISLIMQGIYCTFLNEIGSRFCSLLSRRESRLGLQSLHIKFYKVWLTTRTSKCKVQSVVRLSLEFHYTILKSYACLYPWSNFESFPFR